MELATGIEPVAFALPRRCSTAELRQPIPTRPPDMSILPIDGGSNTEMHARVDDLRFWDEISRACLRAKNSHELDFAAIRTSGAASMAMGAEAGNAD